MASPRCCESTRCCGPSVGQPAPTFSKTALVGGEFRTVQLSDYRGKYLVLFFYPMDFTFVCPTEVLAFSHHAHEFRAINAEVVAASVDSEYVHLAWTTAPRERGGLGGPVDIPLVADTDHSLARDYGVLVGSGADAGVALRGLFIVDPSGVVRQATVNDLPVGRSVAEALRLVKAFQHVERHGEVCPAGWTEGEEAMKPTPEGVAHYLGSHEPPSKRRRVEHGAH
eukprot:m51a1_g14373 putative thioredoxin-dependent peroxide reductase (225) ;mRNA; r:257349-258231